MDKEITLKLNTARSLRESDEMEDDILYPDSRYYRKDKESNTLYKNNRIYEV